MIAKDANDAIAKNVMAKSGSGFMAKSGMNSDAEVYPPEALADEEPRYLRRQKPVEIRRRKFGRKSWPAYRRWLLAGAGILAGGWLVYGSTRFFLYVPRAAVASGAP